MDQTSPRKRTLKKDSTTWKLYRELFYLPEASYPYILPMPSRGAAINLAMGMNTCNIQDAEEQGKPDEVIFLSAKAKALPSGDWVVEVSENKFRLGLRNRSAELENLLSKVQEQNQNAWQEGDVNEYTPDEEDKFLSDYLFAGKKADGDKS